MKLLIVEDEKDVATALAHALTRNGYSIDIAINGSRAFEMLEVNEYDLMILDLNLPDFDGLDVCRITRGKWPALLILILTARREIQDVVTGLDHGADDYLIKPFHIQEILARIRALLRRDLRCRDPLMSFKDLCLDPAEHAVWKNNRRVKLTRKEFGILEYLMRYPGEVVSQESLLEHVWGSTVNSFSNTIRVHIQSLRYKLEKDDSEQKYIETVVGVGYRLLLANEKREE